MEKQTSGEHFFGDFAPQFASINDDVLYGQVWADESLSTRDRYLITYATLLSSGDANQLDVYIKAAKEAGVTKEEMIATTTQVAFYAGWPKGWEALPRIRKIYEVSV